MRYWLEGKPEGLFAEAGAGLFVLSELPQPPSFTPMIFASIAFRYGLPDNHFDLGISGYLLMENPIRFALLPRATFSWIFSF